MDAAEARERYFAECAESPAALTPTSESALMDDDPQERLAGEIQNAVVARLAAEIRDHFNDLSDEDSDWLRSEGQDDLWLIAWNSKPGRTQEQVLELVDAAIARLRPSTTDHDRP